MRVLAVNAGSSSLKLTLLDGEATIAARELDASGGTFDTRELKEALHPPLSEADAVGHRIVHGGERYRTAVRVDDEVEQALRELSELAPLHQARSLAALDATRRALPDVPAVACFDTAFHATLPAAAATYALPEQWRVRWNLRRYGFHGLSHSWVARRAPRVLQRDPSALRIVSCHLGAGVSLCAINGGVSLDTTMGFTPLEGPVMATRSGSVDPGLLVWLCDTGRLTVKELGDGLEHRAGLLGLCGTPDMRELLARLHAGDAAAAVALEVYLRTLRAGIATMAAALDGLDALVFTGGVGEHAHEIRSRAASGLAFLGVELDEDGNRAARADAEIGASEAAARALVLRAREDLEIARQVGELLVA